MPDVHNRAFERRSSAPRLLVDRGAIGARTVLRRVRNRIRRARLRMRRTSLRPLDIAWVATSRREFDRMLIGPTTLVRPIHAFDLDQLVGIERRDIEQCSDLVYIDGLGPLHPDLTTLDVGLPLPTVEDYFGRLLDAFAWLEAQTGKTVIIAAHPRAPRDGSMELRYGGRPIHYGSTAELIARARVVLMSNPSDSLGMVLALGKPVIVLRSVRQEHYEAALCRGLKRFLGAAELWAEHPPKTFTWPVIDDVRYRRMRERYIKGPNSPEGDYWTSVARDLRAFGISQVSKETVTG